MSQVIDIEICSVEEVLKILRSQTDSMPISPTSVRYRRAVDSLHSSLLTLHPSEDDSSPFTLDSLRRCINDWLVNQWLVQTPYSTASLYLDIISALYTAAVKADRLPKTTVFSELKTQLKALGPQGWKSGIDDEIFQRALRLTKNANRLIADDAIAADLILLSLNSPSILRQPILSKADTARSANTPLIPLYEIAQLKSADLVGTHGSCVRVPSDDCVAMERRASGRRPQSDPNHGQSDPSEDCVAHGTATCFSLGGANCNRRPAQSEGNHGQSNSEDSILKTEDSVLSLIFNNLSLRDARRRYVFPLKQSQRTELQLKRHIAKICNALFRRARLPQASDPMQTVEALWAYAALRTGIPASKIVAALGRAPLGLPVLKLVGTHGSCVRSQSFNGRESFCSPRAVQARVNGNHGQSVSEDSRLKTEDSNNCVAHGTATCFSLGGANFNRRPASGDCVAHGTATCFSLGGANCNRPPRVGSNHGQSELNSSPLTLNSFEEDFSQVGKIFLDNPPRWYAMSLRPGVRFTQVCRRIDLITSSNVQRPTSNAAHTARSANTAKPILPKADTARSANTAPLALFYPCEEIARAIGKKIVIKQRPFIHSVVFFKAKLTDIGPLFAKIGDLAWCYRQSAAPGAPYAEISDAQFRLFQQTIASFTPDYEVASSGELELKKDDRVVILGGLFAGHEATFVKSEESRVKSEETSTVYRLNIVGENGIEWRIGVDKRLAKQSN